MTGLAKCVCYGVLFFFLSCLRFSWAGYCPVSYPCTYSCTSSVRYTVKCGLFGWNRCTRYRSESATCSKTCYRQQCCAGYQGTACETPVCFGSTVCPNGGRCVTPDRCSCPTGYTGGPKCEDSNECAINNGGCQHTCTNTIGSFRCSCHAGYNLGSDGKSCININECATNNGGCQHTCTDNTGSFTCSCNQGYSLNTDRRTCSDINECSVGTAGCAQICTNTLGSFTCSCRSGFVADGKSCQDIDECVTGASGCNQLCNNLPGSYRCSCNANYRLEADGKSCTAIPLCSTSQNTCDQICVDEPGSFHCECRSGYNLAIDGSTCNDIDECITSVSRCSQKCTNTIGSFQCSCNPGYVLSNDRLTCTNIDDCASMPCKHGGTCVDHVGRFTCICPPGFTGPTCENDVNECLLINGGCQHVCTNSIGSFSCSCTEGATLASDGFSCTQVGTTSADVFQRSHLARKLLPRGCHDIVLTSCPDGENIEVRLSSTSPWYQSLTNGAIFFSPGVIFAEINDISLPLSLSGVTVDFSGPQFSISLGVAALTPANGTAVGTTRTDDCISLDITPADVFDFIQGNSFLKTLFDKVFAVLPDFLQLSGVDSNLLAVANMRTDFVYGRDMDDTTWCEGAPVIDEHLYTVFRFNTNFMLSIYGNNVNIPSPLGQKEFCLIVDICHNYGGTVFLMIPEGSRQLLQDFNFFKKLKDNQKLSILPRGIGISLVKGINVRSFATSLELWNGDNFFTYPTFARGDVWIGGNVNYNTSVFEVTAVADAFLSVPSPGKILTGVFVEEWNVLAHAGVSQALLKFKLFNKDYAITLLDLQATSIDVYMSVGGLEERKWCGDGALTDIANPPGAFFASSIAVNPFANVPILGEWVLKASTRLHAFFTTNTSQTISPNNTIDIVEDIIQLNLTLNNLDKFLNNLIQSISLSFLNVSSTLIHDVKAVVEETKTILLLQLGKLLQGNIGNIHNLLPQLWGQYVKIKTAVQKFFDAVEFIVSETKDEIISYIKGELQRIKDNIEAAIKKLTDQVTTAVDDYSSFGGKFAIGVKIFGLDLGELDVELSISNDVVAKCSRFEAVYKLLEGQRAVRMLARYSREVKHGFFIVGKKGFGIGGAFGMVSKDAILQLQAYIRILGFSTTADVFLSKTGLYVYLEGNVWNIFLVQVDMSATLGSQWYDLTFTLRGRFVAKARRKRQIQSQGTSFQDSYLDALTKLANKVADEADKRISQAQEVLTKAQNGLTKAQNWLEDKKAAVRKANDAFDSAVDKLEGAKQKLEEAKGPFQDALDKLSAAQKKVENLCTIKDCKKICIPGIKCKICFKNVFFVRVPYPCCDWTSCMISFPDPLCVLANLACRAVRALAYAALEAAKLFVRIPMLALDAAKALVSAAQFIVDKSRIVLVIAEGALDLAKGALEIAKGILEGAKVALEAVKYAIRGAVKILELVIQYGLKALLDVRNCGFEVQMSTTDLPVFEVSCEVNAFKLGWKTIRMRIDFKNAFQTIWRAAKATIDAIVSGFKNVLGRRRREITYASSNKIHKLLRKLRQADKGIPETDIVSEVINIVNQTLGMDANISSSYEGRAKWFEQKCKSVNSVESFLLDSFGALFNIANESRSSMELPANLTDRTRGFNFDALMGDMTLESADISESYGSKVYGLSRSEMEGALLDARKRLHDDPVVREVIQAKNIADGLINEEIQNVGTIPVIEYWISAMRNGTDGYFDDEVCAGFEDCLFYAVTTLYDLYEDETDLPNIAKIRDLITDLESNILSLLQSNTTSVDETFNRAESVYSTIQLLTRLNVFCSTPPRFTSAFRNATVIPGSTVRLDCQTDADPPATVNWFKNGILLPSETGETLVIVNTTVEDDGIFTCAAGNLVANITSPEMTLSVAEPEELCLNQEDDAFLIIDDDNCRTFLKCNSSAQPMCCRGGRKFDAAEGQCITTNDVTCIQTKCPAGYGEECRLVGVDNQPTLYRDLDAHGSPAMHCAPGTFFTQDTCGCNGVSSDPGNGCKREATEDPTRYFDTTSQKEKSCPPGHVFVVEECGCKKEDVEDCRLEAVDGFPNKYLDTAAGIKMTCPPTTVFNRGQCTCVTPSRNNGCWFVPVPGHPKDFLNVVAGIIMTCAPGTIFNPSICACDFPRNVP